VTHKFYTAEYGCVQTAQMGIDLTQVIALARARCRALSASEV